MKDYYEKNKHEFMMTNQVRLSHIIVKTEEDAKKVYERLQKGDDFGKIAAEMSVDKATSKSGGEIGSFKRGDLMPELEEIAFSLRKGEVSMPLRVKDGFQILKVTDAKGPIAEFEKVKEIIRQNIAAQKQRESFDNLLKDLEKKYKVEINKEALSEISFAQPEK
jgi:peptidyl-prolyl cis-trans isomerase C